MGYKIRERQKIAEGTYVSTTYNGFGSYFLSKALASILGFFLKLSWIIIKYTIGLPFVILVKLIKHR